MKLLSVRSLWEAICLWGVCAIFLCGANAAAPNACAIEGPDGSKYDLSPLYRNESTPPYEAKTTSHVFLFNVCGALSQACGGEGAGQAVCQEGGSVAHSCGRADSQTLSVDPNGLVSLQYTHGENCTATVMRSTDIQFTCGPDEANVLSVVENPACHFTIDMVSRYACPIRPPADQTKACAFNSHGEECGPTSYVAVESTWTPEACATLAFDLGYKTWNFDEACITENNVVVQDNGKYYYEPKPSPLECGWSAGIANSNFANTKACLYTWATPNCVRKAVVSVGDSWAIEDCDRFGYKLFGDRLKDMQLMCTFGNFQGGYSIGNSGGGLPPNNCGWTNGTQGVEVNIAGELLSGAGPQQVYGVTASPVSPKVCAGWSADDSEMLALNVPWSWTLENCKQLIQRHLSYGLIQVACVDGGGGAVGSLGGGLPSPNCGW